MRSPQSRPPRGPSVLSRRGPRPDTGTWISEAEVTEIRYTSFASTPGRITDRLVVRRVKDARFPDALFPVCWYHPFFTNTDVPVEAADITHRQHAITKRCSPI